MKKDLRKLSVFLTPAGAGIAIICFFLPWVKVSCGAVTVQASGARIGGTLWISFVLAILVLASFLLFFFWRRKEMFRHRCIALVASVAAFLIIIYRFLSAFAGGGNDIKLGEIASVLKIGAYGSAGGLIMAALGALFMPDRGGRL
jgi:hypothetical protein